MFRKKTLVISCLLLAAFSLCLFSCKVKMVEKPENGDEENNKEETAAPEDPGKFVADYEESDQFFTLMDGMVLGKSPHGKVQIWYSEGLRRLVKRSEFTAPEGAVAIKPFEKGEKKGFAVMIKKGKDYDPENNNWYYAMYSSDDKLLEKPAPGKIEMCIGCHAKDKKKDYLLGTEMGNK